MHFTDANDMLQTLRLPPALREELDHFIISLSLVIGDDAKAAREAQMLHTIQLTMDKGDVFGPNSETDIVTCSLVLQHLVSRLGSFLG